MRLRTGGRRGFARLGVSRVAGAGSGGEVVRRLLDGLADDSEPLTWRARLAADSRFARRAAARGGALETTRMVLRREDALALSVAVDGPTTELLLRLDGRPAGGSCPTCASTRAPSRALRPRSGACASSA